MTTNITSKFIQGTGVAVTTEGDTRILAIHAYSPTAGTFDVQDASGSSIIKCKVPASGTSDIYIGEMGLRTTGTISVSAPASAAAITLVLG